MKAGIDALPPNTKMLLNSGQLRVYLWYRSRCQLSGMTELIIPLHFPVRIDPYSCYWPLLRSNTGEFYGINPPTANLELVARFFEKYPTYADKAFLSVKGGGKVDRLEPDSS